MQKAGVCRLNRLIKATEKIALAGLAAAMGRVGHSAYELW